MILIKKKTNPVCKVVFSDLHIVHAKMSFCKRKTFCFYKKIVFSNAILILLVPI